MNKMITLLTVAAFSSLAALAQKAGTLVTGSVSAAQKPVEAASVGLLRAKDSAVVKMAVSDKAGLYKVENVNPGKYLLVVQAVGYAKQYSGSFELAAGSTSYTAPEVQLKAAEKDLQSVTVTSKKPFIEQKLDKTVINVDASPTNASASILDILEKSPGISVDKDGNISLKGKQGVMVMMDGKPTYLSGQDLANMLKSMPGNNLEQIEIMTNPPAKFDASGNSGVINIKIKKNKIQGFNGSVNTGYGQGVYAKATNSLNLNYRNGKFNFFGNGSQNYNKGFGELSIKRNFRDAATGNILSNFDQAARNDREFSSYNYKAGVDYYMNQKTTLGVVVNGFINKGSEFTRNTTLINDNNGMLVTRTQSTNNVHLDFKNLGLNFNLRHVFDSAGTELTADADYVHYSNLNTQYLNSSFFDNAGLPKANDELLRGLIPSSISIYSGKVDFSTKLKGDVKFEAGVKSSYVETDNDAGYANWNGSQYVTDVIRSNHFLYKENINAGYINFGKQLNKKWAAQLGLRTENTNIKGNQLTTGQTFKRDYTQVFPTLYIGYTLNEKNQFAISYGRRIDRPNYQDLNPFMYFLDKYTYQVGNPYLNPQFSHNIELSHSFNGFLNTSLNYSATNDIIQDVFEQVDSTTTTYVKKSNIAKRQNFGISVSAGFPVTKWWRTNLYMNGNYNKFKGLVNGGQVEVDGSNFVANMQNMFTFSKGWGGEISGFYRSRSVEGVLVANEMGAVNVAVSKQVLKNKGSLKLIVRDALYTQKFSGYSRYQNVDLTLRQIRDSRVVTLNFTYRFGKGKITQPRKKNTSVEEQSRVSGGGGN
ncbi:TonB-dependent receptor [Sediminibacterium ginsengisoli]|uniref:Outer membrane receptor proteins, mostly Fe transport n=1 Tax=Sediminibacterium ginsengisoli TaxID=413434 RepID=A0A1T4R3P6_9BACT|nr:TonB-dependent receptor [Sediminibacterium ginsengisoli]SKA10291.1 Outer membrane receptor proteins, mostly Fe transport [Sediminibacterium ginsengisoli]